MTAGEHCSLLHDEVDFLAGIGQNNHRVELRG